jgi:hypothetical protein
VNQNHLKQLFTRFSLSVQKYRNVLKHFRIFLFDMILTVLVQNQKRSTRPKTGPQTEPHGPWATEDDVEPRRFNV